MKRGMMRISRIGRVMGLAMIAMVAVVACSDSPSAPAPVATTLRIEPGTVSLAMGASQQLSAVTLDQSGMPMVGPPSGAEVVWSSGDTTLVAIDEAGMVVGRRPGTTTIVARAGTLEGSVAATVVPAELVLENGRSVTASIGPAGGALVTEGAGGIRYRLEIPPAAILEQTEITLTPVASIGNAPFLELLGAVRFAPDGLLLQTPARLTIELTAVPAAGQSITGFTFPDDGRELHRWLANVSGRTATVPIAHFSGAGVARAQDVRLFARHPESQDQMNRIFDLYVEHFLSGEWDVPGLVAAFREWYLEVVEPRLSDVSTDNDVYDAIRAWRLWLDWIAMADEIADQLIAALGSEIDEARVLAAAALLTGIDHLNARCIEEELDVWAWLVPGMQHMAEEFGFAASVTGLDAETVQAEICIQVHIVDLIFPAEPTPGEAAELIVRTGTGFGGGPPAVSGLIRTRITPSGSTDDSETSEESVEVIRAIVPTGEQDLVIEVRSCYDLPQPPEHAVRLNDICDEDTIVRRFTDLSGTWNLVVDGICTGTMTVAHTGPSLSISGSIGGGFCPFDASGSGNGTLDVHVIRFGLALGSSSDGMVVNASFTGTVAPGGARMTGTYLTSTNLMGTWEATR